MKYRKKPVVIDAEQFVVWDLNQKPKTVRIFGVDYEVQGSLFSLYIEIPTLEGIMKADHTDYIIKGVKGEIYSCKPDIFKMTYESVE